MPRLMRNPPDILEGVFDDHDYGQLVHKGVLAEGGATGDHAASNVPRRRLEHLAFPLHYRHRCSPRNSNYQLRIL